MSKKLKIQFWKAERALAMQILEQEGLPKRKDEGDVRIWNYSALFRQALVLYGKEEFDLNISHIEFATNTERDEYLQKSVNAITDELFAGGGELKIGEMCEVWDLEFKKWEKRKLLAILPENYEERFIVSNLYYPNRYVPFSDARPITKRIEPTIEECGNVVTYTWEEK